MHEMINDNNTYNILSYIGCIENSPESVKVIAGEWANFSCAINCSDVSLRWCVVSPVMEVVNNHFIPARRLVRVWGSEGITMQFVTEGDSGDFESVTIWILATEQMNGAVVQCGAISFKPNVCSLYSKFAVLEVEPVFEPFTQSNTNDDEVTTDSQTSTPP